MTPQEDAFRTATDIFVMPWRPTQEDSLGLFPYKGGSERAVIKTFVFGRVNIYICGSILMSTSEILMLDFFLNHV